MNTNPIADPLTSITRSTRGRIARLLMAQGILFDNDPDWIIDTTVRSFLRGRARRLESVR